MALRRERSEPRNEPVISIIGAGMRIEGEVSARRLVLEDGAVLNGSVRMGEVRLPALAGKAVGEEPTRDASREGEFPRSPQPADPAVAVGTP
jgi:hypothetical protein